MSFPNRDDNFRHLAARTPATPVNFTEELVAGGSSKTILGDKGFLDPWREQLLENRYGTRLIVPKRKNMKEQVSLIDQIKAKVCRKIRRVVETVGSRLTERLSINKIRIHDLRHFQSRLMRKILTHTGSRFFSICSSREIRLTLMVWF